MRERTSQPAVFIGGPPHAGKSVLTYSLTRALRQYGIEHYVIRAYPDGEGHWSQEMPQQVAERLRRHYRGPCTNEFIQSICADIDSRQVPFLIDVGGLPQGEQFQIFQHCTAAILLLTSGSEAFWHGIIARFSPLLLAEFRSDLHGTPSIEAHEPVLRGVLTGLERGTTIQSEPFECLVRLLASRFVSTTQTPAMAHLTKAPTERVLHLPQILDLYNPGGIDWTPSLLPRLLSEVPTQTPLAVYGSGPHWLYSALLLHTSPAPFAQFDARLGWLKPLSLRSGPTTQTALTFSIEEHLEYTYLFMDAHGTNLIYEHMDRFTVPAVSTTLGLVLSGRLPLWMLSSLAHFYQSCEVPWIAHYHPSLDQAVVVFSRVANYAPGDCLPVPSAIIDEV